MLASVDVDLQRRLNGKVRGFRHYDDYELVFDTVGEAESAQVALAAAAAAVELQLNSVKTKIRQLPLPLTNLWTRKLREPFEPFGMTNRSSAILERFETAFELKRALPDDFVLAYLIGRMEHERLRPDEWALAERLLAQCANVEPSAMPHVVRVWSARRIRGQPLDLDLVSETIERTITSHAPLDHGSEVAWAVWAAIALNLPLGKASTAGLVESSDDVVALLALDAQDRNLAKALDVSSWASRMTTDELKGPHWLLAYEASKKGWLPTAGGGDHIASDASFAWMRRANVSFYRRFRRLTARVVQDLRRTLPGGYGGDYDDDDFDEDQEDDDSKI